MAKSTKKKPPVKRRIKRTAKKPVKKKPVKKPSITASKATAAAKRGPKAKRPSPDQKMLPTMADARDKDLDGEITGWQKAVVAKNNAGGRIKKALGKIGSLLKKAGIKQYSLNGDKFVLVPGEEVVKHMTVKDK